MVDDETWNPLAGVRGRLSSLGSHQQRHRGEAFSVARPPFANSLRSDKVSKRRSAPTKAPHSQNGYSITSDPITLVYSVEIESGIQVAPRHVNWRFDAVPSNGGNRILSSGAPQKAGDAGWTHGNSAFFSLSTLDGDPLMDVHVGMDVWGIVVDSLPKRGERPA